MLKQFYTRHFLFYFTILFAVVLGACSTGDQEAELVKSKANTEANSEPPANDNTLVNSTAQISPESKIIRTATIKMQVNNFRESLAALENTLKNHQAFVATSNESHAEDKLENTLTIRVPAAHLDALLNNIVKHGVHLDYKNITSDDFTAEFVDISARLKSKKLVEERYLSFLKEAKNLKDMLELENEVRKIREEIEATQARINYINSQTAYSTITLEVYQFIPVQTPTGNSYGVRIVNALSGGWEILLSLTIGLLYIWPLLLLVPIFIYFSRRFLQKYPPVR
jgi:hypothetical protein